MAKDRAHQKALGPPGYQGNINLRDRKAFEWPSRKRISTLHSTSFLDQEPGSETFGKHVLVPTIRRDGRAMWRGSYEEGKPDMRSVVKYYRATGEKLGAYDTPEEATTAAIEIARFQDTLNRTAPFKIGSRKFFRPREKVQRPPVGRSTRHPVR